VDDIRPGMVLCEDIRDSNGRFLLGKGLTVQEKHLRVFKIWGVSQANIQGEGNREEDKATRHDPEALKKIRKKILNRFQDYNPDSLLCRTLVDVFTLYSDDDAHEQADDYCSGQNDFQEQQPGRKDRRLADPESRIGNDVRLVSLPEIFFLIQEAIKDPRTSSKHIGDIISKDQALAAKLLKLVNSAFYGFPSRIDTISRAVTIIGTRQLSSLALGISALSRFENISPEIMDMESFWKHSIACAIGAKTLANHCKLPNSELFFVCGLLHDIGKLIMLSYYPGEYLQVLSMARQKRIALARAEKSYFKNDHAVLGANLLKKWKLPLRVESGVRYHERPAVSRFPMEATMVHMANILAVGSGIGSGGEAVIPAPDEQSWLNSRLDSGVLQQTVKLTMAQVDNIYRLLFNRV
ncbi:MAG: HDOD domain-containing protein, partial [Desulfonatronovibrio sp.]